MNKLILVAALLPLAACGPANPRPVTSPATAPGNQVGAANPAAVFCTNLGGTVQTRGQASTCRTPDGRTHDLAALYRANIRL
ncbi:MAG: DUF333 domain-containing protein [Paracoccus sp. (in: a-proteobacteria)]|nr:DUF333 domain-containing protein [Paracoccus sp. (in: a-proteobacteria)]